MSCTHTGGWHYTHSGRHSRPRQHKTLFHDTNNRNDKTEMTKLQNKQTTSTARRALLEKIFGKGARHIPPAWKIVAVHRGGKPRRAHDTVQTLYVDPEEEGLDAVVLGLNGRPVVLVCVPSSAMYDRLSCWWSRPRGPCSGRLGQRPTRSPRPLSTSACFA